MKNYAAFIVISALVIYLGCKYDVESFNYSDYNCGREPSIDSLYIAQHIIGKWNWKNMLCSEGMGNENIFAGLSLQFIEDGTVNTLQNNVITNTSAWRVVIVNDIYKLSISPGIEPTRGDIRLCDDYLTFDELGEDLCNNYFSRN